jgi:peptidoglycan hydrolase-like protein with peptidoglycan-binding domain
MKSRLTNVTILTDHKSSRNGTKVDKITIHHMAGNLSAESCGRVFQNREASANYGIDSNGRVGCYVDEDYRAWSTANPSNDRRAINIELANDVIGGDWHVSDKAINKCIDLCVDICQRHGISRLNYTGGTDGNLTRHNMFMATTCPGPYLQSKFPYIASEVNKRLGGQPSPSPTPSGNTTIKYIQGTLNIRYGYKLDVDGLVGRDTWKHLRMALQHELNVQFNAGLVEDGILGVKSQQALSRVIVRKGAQGNITWLIQACLNIKGYSTNGIDGIFGSGTSNAVYRFQQNNGLAKDSIVGKNTFLKLFN